ncbi:MAG: helix-turn-helix transcriptional regulator [Clostridia bacterium]|nr:helix-turn-helix transcriptional regulator [Clostridia bacterium]
MKPIIDLVATGANIKLLRRERGVTVAKIQSFLSLESPRSIYKWQSGSTLPNVENLLGLSIILGVSMNDIVKTA